MVTIMEKQEVKEGIITFGDWSPFAEKLHQLHDEDFISEESLCQAMEVDYEEYSKVVRSAFYCWKDSPSKSLFHGLGVNGLKIPKIGDPIFIDYLSQTRFLLMLCNSQLGVARHCFGNIRDEHVEKVKVRGEAVLTYSKNPTFRQRTEDNVNKVLQMLYLYFLYCRKQEEKEDFKMPKKLYRGIRFRDLVNAPVIKETLEEIWKEPYSRERLKREYDCIVQILKEQGLQVVCESLLVSFTASKAIAKYFANNNGIIVEVKPNDVEVMTSEVHDERFAERDEVSNKYEREYIVRVGEYLPVTDVMIYDVDYYIAINSPLAVNLFDHSDKSATYVLNGVKIKAYYVWTSNTTSTILYRNLDDEGGWGLSSREFKEMYGFSPVINRRNLDDIQDFQIHIER